MNDPRLERQRFGFETQLREANGFPSRRQWAAAAGAA